MSLFNIYKSSKAKFELIFLFHTGIGAGIQDTSTQITLSPVFEHIIASQFTKTKCGDPYFFTNQLSAQEIDILKDYSFKDILCLASDGCGEFQDFVFLTPGKSNPLEHCNSTLDLSEWTLKVKRNSTTVLEDESELVHGSESEEEEDEVQIGENF